MTRTILWVSGEPVAEAEYVRASADSVRYRLQTGPGGSSRWEVTRLSDPEKTRFRPILRVQRTEALVEGIGGAIIGEVPDEDRRLVHRCSVHQYLKS